MCSVSLVGRHLEAVAMYLLPNQEQSSLQKLNVDASKEMKKKKRNQPQQILVMVTVSLLSWFKITVLLGNGREQKTSLQPQLSRLPQQVLLVGLPFQPAASAFETPSVATPPSQRRLHKHIHPFQGVFSMVSVLKLLPRLTWSSLGAPLRDRT